MKKTTVKFGMDRNGVQMLFKVKNLHIYLIDWNLVETFMSYHMS